MIVKLQSIILFGIGLIHLRMKIKFRSMYTVLLCIILRVGIWFVSLDISGADDIFSGKPDNELNEKKTELSLLIRGIFRKFPDLSYFQGYHDIAQVLLLVLDFDIAHQALENLSLFRIRDYMLPSLTPTIRHLELIPYILRVSDFSLYRHMRGIQPFFALAATLTLYAHEIERYGDITRLFDFILAHEPVLSIYLYIAIIISKRQEVFEISLNEPEMIHFTLSKLPRNLDLESLISSASEIYRANPPQNLPSFAWYHIPNSSVLKTSRDLSRLTTHKEALFLLRKQLDELQYEEKRKKAIDLAWKYRRPASSIGTAILVGVVSYWLMRSGVGGISPWKKIFSHLFLKSYSERIP